jgi:hypothetical protein
MDERRLVTSKGRFIKLRRPPPTTHGTMTA